MSTESIAGSAHAPAVSEVCASCGAPLARDQRYCLECGERRIPASSVLQAGPPGRAEAPTPPAPPGARTASQPGDRSNVLPVIAGVGVLLLAMGVGVLIGRSGNSRPAAAPAQVITVAGGSGTGATSAAAGEAAFKSDWPSGTDAYTVQLQTLPQAGTTVSAVAAAKSAAGGKGATGVGALKSGDFASLPAGNYVIYAGVYHTKADAQKALGGLKKKFPGASVIHVSIHASGSSGSRAGPSVPTGSGNDVNHPAPPSVVESLKNVKGKNYEEKSKNLPNVVSTG